ncbi:MAG: hypothetical protein OEZ47_17695 [Gammaproteobacteria bacterium]|nr:hypothetical protein [Gammaproteobacteria bacterium]
MTIVDLAKIASAIFAGVSVLVAIFIYRKNSEREYFANIRRKFVRYRSLVSEANEIFQEIGLVEVGAKISEKLRLLCPSDYSTNQIQEFFYDEENADFIRQAIYLGLGESSTVHRAKKIARELDQLNSELVEPFPITKVTLGILTAYFTAMTDTLSSGELIDNIFETVREKKEEYEPHSEDELLHPDLVFRQMAIYITLFHVDFANEHGEKMLCQVERILNIITHNYELKSDGALRKLRKLEKKKLPEYKETADTISEGKKVLFEYLKFYKSDLDSEDWDDLVESKTLLESAFPVDTEDA